MTVTFLIVESKVKVVYGAVDGDDLSYCGEDEREERETFGIWKEASFRFSKNIVSLRRREFPILQIVASDGFRALGCKKSKP